MTETILRYRMIEPGQKIGVAISGGADSVCLLHLLNRLAPEWNLSLFVLHVDHMLRGEESRADAEFVRELAKSFRWPFFCHRADVYSISNQKGDNLEQAARQVRREYFLGLLKEGAVDRIALGHTCSDQAETVLFRLLRGSGTAGLAAMRPVSPEGFLRPLIELDRQDIEAYLRERGIPWRTDSTNAARTFARNRIRHDLIPALTREWNPELAQALARTATLAQEDEDYWAAEIGRLATEYLKIEPPAVFVHAGKLSGLHRAQARRLVRRALEIVRGDLRRIEFSHIEQVLKTASTTEGHGRIQLPGVDVFRSFEWIRFAPPGMEKAEYRDYRVPLSVPGHFRMPGAKSEIWLEFVVPERETATLGSPQVNSGYNGIDTYLDWDRISGSIELRNWMPGDQYRPVGQSAEIKLKLLFQKARIPLWKRRNWPIITDGAAILWTRLFGPAAAYAATPASRTVLKIHEITTEVSEI